MNTDTTTQTQQHNNQPSSCSQALFIVPRQAHSLLRFLQDKFPHYSIKTNQQSTTTTFIVYSVESSPISISTYLNLPPQSLTHRNNSLGPSHSLHSLTHKQILYLVYELSKQIQYLLAHPTPDPTTPHTPDPAASSILTPTNTYIIAPNTFITLITHVSDQTIPSLANLIETITSSPQTRTKPLQDFIDNAKQNRLLYVSQRRINPPNILRSNLLCSSVLQQGT